ncbi:MAG: hypothetical protein ISR44_07505 [Rhodospirillales bacterium]|nr:hypothetical protein [Rhodospirillales bacterium]
MNVGRVIALFLYCFGVFVVPMAIILPLVFIFMPNPYVIQTDLLAVENGVFKTPQLIFGEGAKLAEVARSPIPGALAAEGATYEDGAWASVSVFATPEAGRTALDVVLDRIPRNATTQTPGTVTFTRSDNGRRGLLTTIGPYLFLVDDPTEDDPRSRLELLPVVAENPEKNFVTVILFDYWQWSLAALIAYILVQFLIFPRLGSWATRVGPDAGVVAIDGQALRRRLLDINNLNVPFEVKPGKRDDELIVEWRHTDDRWVGLMSVGGVKILARIRLRIDDDRSCLVRSQDATSTVQWSVGVADPASFRWRGSKGIVFKQYDRGRAYGLVFKNGKLVLDDAYNYRFDLDEMKNPIVAIIIGSGWAYNPVVTFNRVFN